MVRVIGVLSVLGILLAGVSCGQSQKPAGEIGRADSPAPILSGPPGGSSGQGSAEEQVSPEGSPAEEGGPSTAVIGDTVKVVDWDVKVTGVNKNADAAIAEASQYNDKPKGHYVLVTFEATYRGETHTGNWKADLRWTMTTSDNLVHDDASVLTEADKDSWPSEARTGGTLKGIVVFDVPDTDGAILSVSALGRGYTKVYADFPLS